MIQCGIVDCFPRLFPRAVYRYSFLLPDSMRSPVVRTFKRLRLLLGPLYPNFREVPPRQLEELLLSVSDRLVSRKTIFVGPPPANAVLDRRYLESNLVAHYAVLSGISDAPNISLVDLRELFRDCPKNHLQDDGVHLSCRGHARLGKFLAEMV